MIKLQFPDGAIKEFPEGTPASETLGSLPQSIRKKALAVKLDDELQDLATPLRRSGKFLVITDQDPAALDILRHTASHIMAQAVMRLYPGTLLGFGPQIENGFYYDFDLDTVLAEEHFSAIEKEMKKIVDANLPVARKEIAKAEALEFFKNDKYKVELISELADGTISLYSQGEFIDLCRGPHLPSTGKVKAFKLLNVAGAYWRGSEKNKMLQRIYATAFFTPVELDAYLKQMEEARKRDHSRLGKELDLYVVNPAIGKGLPLFTPKGTIIKMQLQRWIEDEEMKRGYQYTSTPVLAKTDLYKISGHLDHYRDKMFVFKTDENEELALRPMTCPYQFMIYKSRKRSYRELPIRYAETSLLFRKEKSGELHGLIRIWQFTLADAHIICMPSQIEEEFEKVLDLIQYIMKTLGFTEYWYRFSQWDPAKKDKFIDNPQAWADSQTSLRKILDKLQFKYEEAVGDAAFYGPKLDVQMKNVWGKEDTIFTVQIDFALPQRFDLTYVASDNTEARPMVIHRSSIGCYERTMALLIEHYAGAFPLWLSPVQVRVLTVTDRADARARELETALRNAGIRVEADLRNEKIGFKIREAQLEKIPYMIVLGDTEIADGTLAVRRRSGQQAAGVAVDTFIAELKGQIDKKSLDR